MREHTVRTLWHEQPGLHRGYIVDLLTALVVGMLLVLGGRQRTRATAWDVVNANGGPVVWGLCFVIGGLLLAFVGTHSTRIMVGVLWLLALGYLILAISWLASAIADPAHGASFVGAVFAGRAAFMHTSRAQAYREAPRWTR